MASTYGSLSTKACAVRGCTTSYRDRSNDVQLVSFHRFPKDADQKKLWTEKCGRSGDDTFDLERGLVCSNHFTENDFQRHERIKLYPDSAHTEHSFIKFCRLHPGAVPSKNLMVSPEKSADDTENKGTQTIPKDDKPVEYPEIKTEEINIDEKPLFDKADDVKLHNPSIFAETEAIGPPEIDQELAQITEEPISIFEEQLTSFFYPSNGSLPRVYPSGAQKRKLQTEREEAMKRKLLESTGQCLLSMNKSIPATSKSNIPKIGITASMGSTKMFEFANSICSSGITVSSIYPSPSSNPKFVARAFTEDDKINISSVTPGKKTVESDSKTRQDNLWRDADVEVKAVMKSGKKQLSFYFEKPPDISKCTSNNFCLNKNLSYPTDRGHFVTCGNMDAFLKMDIINYGPCKPDGPFPKDDKNRSFSSDYYWKKSLSGMKIPRYWLCYSQKMNSVYCEPCWLFAEKLLGSRDTVWSRGLNDWQGLSKKLKDHEISQTHMMSCITYDSWKSKKGGEALQQAHWKESISLWNDILRRVVDLISTLTTSGISVNERVFDNRNTENSFTFQEALTRSDRALSFLLHKPKYSSYSQLNDVIQCELLDSLASEMLNNIITEIKEAQFYSIALHHFSFSEREEIALVFRYVNTEYFEESPSDLNISEHFVRFFPISEDLAKTTNEILDFFEKNEILFKRCRGISCDGVKSANEIYSKLHNFIQNKESKASYVHCSDHDLSSTMMNAVTIPEILTYYKYIQRIFKYFGKNLARWDVLKKISSNILSDSLSQEQFLKWDCYYDVIFSIYRDYKSFMQTLNRIILISQAPDEIEEAKYIRNYMESSQFVLISIVQYKILEATYSLSKSLHTSDLDLLTASKALNEAYHSLADFRNHYEEALESAHVLAGSWAALSFRTEIMCRSSDLAVDRRLDDSKEWFRINVFEANLDSVLHQLRKECSSMRQVSKDFNFLRPSHLIEVNERNLLILSYDLACSYPNDLTTDFTRQILFFRNFLIQELESIKLNSMLNVAKLLIIRNSTLLSSLPDVSTAFRLFLTLPIIEASDRHLSKFQIIKNYVSSPFAGVNSPSLCTIGIESEKGRQFDFPQIIENIAMKALRSGTVL